MCIRDSAYTTPAVDLIQLAGKYIFGGGGSSKPADATSSSTPDASPNDRSPTP